MGFSIMTSREAWESDDYSWDVRSLVGAKVLFSDDWYEAYVSDKLVEHRSSLGVQLKRVWYPGQLMLREIHSLRLRQSI